MNDMETLNILPGDIIRRIADSYRMRQLMRFTCRTWYDQLGECKYRIVTAPGDISTIEDCTRREFIGHLTSQLCCKS
jgi:hypothetical protein